MAKARTPRAPSAAPAPARETVPVTGLAVPPAPTINGARADITNAVAGYIDQLRRIYPATDVWLLARWINADPAGVLRAVQLLEDHIRTQRTETP